MARCRRSGPPASAIGRERERGNLELLITTPVSPGQLMAGKLLPYVAIGLIQTTLILTLGYWFFHVTVAGRLIDLYLGALLFIAASLSLGLLISTVAQWIAQVLPLTHFNEIIRGIVLRGTALSDLRSEIGKLALILAVMLAFSMARFRKRLD